MANVCMKTKKECVHTKSKGFSVTIGCSGEVALANASTFSSFV